MSSISRAHCRKNRGFFRPAPCCIMQGKTWLSNSTQCCFIVEPPELLGFSSPLKWSALSTPCIFYSLNLAPHFSFTPFLLQFRSSIISLWPTSSRLSPPNVDCRSRGMDLNDTLIKMQFAYWNERATTREQVVTVWMEMATLKTFRQSTPVLKNEKGQGIVKTMIWKREKKRARGENEKRPYVDASTTERLWDLILLSSLFCLWNPATRSTKMGRIEWRSSKC